MKPEAVRRPKKTVQLEKIYSHPPGRVWQALTDPQALAQWLLPNSFQPRTGHRFRFLRRSPGGKSEKVQCQVVEVEAPRRLAYTWQAEGEDAPTLVTWTLEPVEEGTRLRLEHIGPETSCALSGSLLSVMDRFGGFLQTGLTGISGEPMRSLKVGRIVMQTRSGTLRCIGRRSAGASSPFCVSRHEEVSL